MKNEKHLTTKRRAFISVNLIRLIWNIWHSLNAAKIDSYNFWTAYIVQVEEKKGTKTKKMGKWWVRASISFGKKRASLIGPKLHCEHIINHSIIAAHQSILMPAVIIDSVGDNPSMGSLLSAGIWWSLDLNCIRAPVYLWRLSFSSSEAQGVVNIKCTFLYGPLWRIKEEMTRFPLTNVSDWSIAHASA